MKQNNELKKLKPKIVRVLKKYGIKKAGVFGSVARGEAGKKSDVDILIQPNKNTSLLDIAGLGIELEENLGRRVDIVSYKYIHPYLKEKILDSEVRII